jgi:hypothetical protein
MPRFINLHWLTLAFTSVVQLVLFFRWIYRKIRNDEITRAFVRDMATNHLPHIYELLGKLCDERGIARTPLPPIRWIDLNGKQR